MRLFFIRHGESEANRLRVISNRGRVHGLTGLGRAQVAALAQRPSAIAVDALYCSPLLRAIETAQILAHAWAVPVQPTDALREFDCGELEGRSDADAWARYAALVAAWVERGEHEQRLPGGESFADLRARFVPFVQSLAAAPHTVIALVGHGGLFKLMLPLVLTNLPPAWAWAQPLPNAVPIQAEGQGGQWVCLDWCGVAPPAPLPA
jgi:broad specificity phosphatase PhoE